jgi:hypothetical protein
MEMEVFMGSHPINLALRFILELIALFSMGYWGWTQHDGVSRFLWMIGLPLIAAILWGTFAVPDDPSRSGQAPVPVPGILRLLLELAIFALGVWCLFSAGLPTYGMILGIVVILHYLASYDRIIWLLKN